MANGNVLVVEDDDVIRRLLIDCLRSRPELEVAGARDGVEALHMLVNAHYDLVVLDLVMPKMTGIDLLDSLTALSVDRSLPYASRPPAVIVITSKTEDDVSSAMLRHRFQIVRAVFRKPVDVAALSRELERGWPV